MMCYNRSLTGTQTTTYKCTERSLTIIITFHGVSFDTVNKRKNFYFPLWAISGTIHKVFMRFDNNMECNKIGNGLQFCNPLP